MSSSNYPEVYKSLNPTSSRHNLFFSANFLLKDVVVFTSTPYSKAGMFFLNLVLCSVNAWLIVRALLIKRPHNFHDINFPLQAEIGMKLLCFLCSESITVTKLKELAKLWPLVQVEGNMESFHCVVNKQENWLNIARSQGRESRLLMLQNSRKQYRNITECKWLNESVYSCLFMARCQYVQWTNWWPQRKHQRPFLWVCSKHTLEHLKSKSKKDQS